MARGDRRGAWWTWIMNEQPPTAVPSTHSGVEAEISATVTGVSLAVAMPSMSPGLSPASAIAWLLRHVNIGTQDAALFEVPHDYARACRRRRPRPLLGMRLARPPAR
jgi:hypothetical protein